MRSVGSDALTLAGRADACRPWRNGYCPVRKAARDGVQTGCKYREKVSIINQLKKIDIDLAITAKVGQHLN